MYEKAAEVSRWLFYWIGVWCVMNAVTEAAGAVKALFILKLFILKKFDHITLTVKGASPAEVRTNTDDQTEEETTEAADQEP